MEFVQCTAYLHNRHEPFASIPLSPVGCDHYTVHHAGISEGKGHLCTDPQRFTVLHPGTCMMMHILLIIHTAFAALDGILCN